MMGNIYGAFDKETEERHLREYPLKEGWNRMYIDHTGRVFEDYDPNAPVDPVAKELFDILQEEIRKEMNKEIIDEMSAYMKDSTFMRQFYYWGA